MLGDTTIKNHVKNSQTLDIKPRVFIEINHNDNNNAYFCGTGTQSATTLQNILLTLSNTAGTPQAVDAGTSQSYSGRGIETALTTPNNNAALLKTSQPSTDPTEYSWSTETSAGQNCVKFNMFLKSDYVYQLENGDTSCLESFDVLIVAEGIDSSNKKVLSETVSETVTVDSVSWKPVSILFANPDQFSVVNKVRLTFYITSPASKKSALLVGQLTRSTISDYEVYSSNRIPLERVFESGRPGEFLVEMSGSLESPAPTKPSIQGIAQQCTPMHMATYCALGPKYELVQRSVTPYPGNVYTYYVSGTSTESRQVWALYKNKIKTNKIVLKFNTISYKPQTVAVNILTSSGWSSSIAGSSTVNADGTFILYYNGTSWTTNKWTSTSYPSISTSGSNVGDVVLGSNLGYQEIWGIRVEGVALQVTNTDFIDLPGRLELIEVSPRLDIDLTNFVTNVSTTEEASSNSLLNIGGITSNTYTINLYNDPIIKNLHDPSVSDTSNKDIRPISTISSTSVLNKILSKGNKIRGGYDIDTSYRGVGIASGKTYVPAFVGYIDKWTESNNSISISAFDAIKDLLSTKTQPIYLESKRISECIYSVLDPIGFGEVYGDELINLKVFSNSNNSELTFSQNEKIKYFWTSNDRNVSETLNDLFRIYQIAMYTDQYGAVRFKTLYEYSKSYSDLTKTSSPASPDIYVQDKNDSNSKSNLISVDVEENEKPQSIIVKYKSPRPTLSQPKLPRTNKDKKAVDQNSLVTQKKSTDRVWILQDDSYIVPYIQLTGKGITTASQNYIQYDTSLTNVFMRAVPYSSHLLIDQEIVSYDGLEYEFTYTSNSVTVTKRYVVNSAEELEMIKSDIFSNKSGKNISFKPSGKLMNVKRGLFGTPPSIHNRQTSSTTPPWSMKKFNRGSNAYNNATPSSKFSPTVNGINITSNDNDEVLFLYPKDTDSDANLLKDKRRLLCQFKLGDIPSKKEGYVGVGVGVQINGSGKMVGGLLVWVGVEEDKKKQNPTIYIEQIKSDGTIETVIEKDQFEYSDRVIEEDENMEIYIALNEKRDECKVLIGGSTAFEKIINKKVDGKKKEIKQHTFKIRQLSLNSQFGFIANKFGTATLGQYLFGVSDQFKDMNNINLSLVDSKYSKPSNRPTGTYFIGSNNLLDTIVDGRNVIGLRTSSKHNFAYTGAPVARGIQIFDVEYDKYPIISNAKAEWTGYTYDSNIFEGGNIISERKP
jgi:hypothetical protein